VSNYKTFSAGHCKAKDWVLQKDKPANVHASKKITVKQKAPAAK